MSSTDLTKASNHLYYLWAALTALASLTMTGYLALRDRNECLAEKISANEMTLKIQLVEIKTTLTNVEATLIELKRDIKRRPQE